MISKKLRITVNIAKRPIIKMVRDRTSPRYLFEKRYKVSLTTMEDLFQIGWSQKTLKSVWPRNTRKSGTRLRHASKPKPSWANI